MATPELEPRCSREPLDLFTAPHETRDIALSNDGELVAATDGAEVVIWEQPTDAPRQVLGNEHPGPIQLLAFSPNGRRLAAVGAETLIIWNLEDSSVVRRARLYHRQQRLFYLELDGREWLVIGRGSVRSNDPQPPALVVEIDGDTLLSPFEPQNRGTQIAVARERLVIVRPGEPAVVWLGPEREPLELSEALGPVAISTDGRIVASGMRGDVSTWDTETGMKLAHLHNDGVYSSTVAVAFSPDHRQIAALYLDGGGVLWDTLSGTIVTHLSSPAGYDAILTFSLDGRYVLTGVDGIYNQMMGHDPALVWMNSTSDDAQSWELPVGDFLRGLELSRDGRLLAVAGFNSGRLWCLAAVGDELLPGS